MWISYKPENNPKYSCSRALPALLEAIDILTCVSLMQSLTQALSLFPLWLSRKRHGLWLVTWFPKFGNPPYTQKMQFEQHVKRFKRQKLRKHGVNIPTDLRREAIDVTNAFELKGKLACFPRAWHRLPLFALRCEWLVKRSRELLRFVVG